LYYLEAAPLLAFLTALGLVRAVDALLAGSAKRQVSLTTLTQRLHERLITPGRGESPRTIVAVTALAIAGLAAGAVVARQVRAQIRNDHAYYDAFARLIDRIPESRAIVFVRYGEKHLDGLSLVRNVADAERAKVWTVYDRGSENARLLAMVPDRTPYLFDESSWTLQPLDGAVHSERTALTVTTDSVRERREARRPR
jgi:hypothetical protein